VLPPGDVLEPHVFNAVLLEPGHHLVARVMRRQRGSIPVDVGGYRPRQPERVVVVALQEVIVDEIVDAVFSLFDAEEGDVLVDGQELPAALP
jgi:hypothetical protein